MRTRMSVFLITLSGLVLEVGLTRIYSASIWYHFAFVAISVALLGWGLGGFTVHLLKQRVRLSMDEAALLTAAIAPAIAAVLMTGVRVKGSEGRRAKGEGRSEASLSPASRAEGNKKESEGRLVAKPSPLTLSQGERESTTSRAEGDK